MKIVVALGGNALLKRGEPMTEAVQRANVGVAAVALVQLIDAGHQLVITHGNGPQVGLIALQADAGPEDGQYPLDVLGAESQGMIGYLIEQELRNLLPADAVVAAVLTQVVVSRDDDAFLHPTKPIGPVYGEREAQSLMATKGWTCAPDGKKWRRVVASPDPLELLQLSSIATLVDHGVTVICAGGGGVPVARNASGKLEGVEAVIDKDFTSQLLAQHLKADMLLLLTDVDAVYVNYGTPNAAPIARMGPDPQSATPFDTGSMGPKVEAATRFAMATGKDAAIGRIQDAAAVVLGNAGTIVQALDIGTEYRV
ncbi:MAG: carbamate kinase [Cypionkella sp.]